MAWAETWIGGSAEAFPETLWSSILSNPDLESEDRRRGLQKLCGRYWKPVYNFIRLSWKCSIEDAKDLTQEFFGHLLESNLVGRYKPGNGRFRSYLKGAVTIFLAEAHRTARRQKRGGGQVILPLEIDPEDSIHKHLYPDDVTPDEVFDREWARALMADCVAELESRLRSDGKDVYFEVYKCYDLRGDDGPRPTYSEVAETLKLKVHDVRNFLAYARARLRDLLAGRIREYVSSGEELAQEINELSRLYQG
jgi:RNA polymerase sigma-70 factor (ECF subfamily)